MTAIKPVLEFVIDANIALALAFCIWACVHGLARTFWLKHDFGAQLRFLKLALVLTLASPLLALGTVASVQWLWPQVPLTISDMAVAAYLRGDIALPATQFEALLNTRDRWTDALFAGQMPWLALLLGALAAGVALQIGRSLQSVFVIRRALRRSYLWRRTDRVDIRLSDHVSMPFAVRGLRRRHIVLPSTLVLQPRQLRFVLAHECQHIRAADVEWEIAMEVLRPIFFANPAFYLWKRAFERLRELACDQSVIARRAIPFRDYSACLLDFCAQRLNQPMPQTLRVAFYRGGAKRELLHRLTSLQKVAVRRHWSILPMLSVCLVLGVALSATTLRQPGDWSHDRLMLSSIVNLERFNAIDQTPLN